MPRAFYWCKMCKKSKSPPFLYYKMFAIVMLWGSRFGQMRMFSFFMMTIFDNTFWWQFSISILENFQIFEILWPETWHLRHWLHCWQLRTTLLRITLWPWIACDRDSILNSWDVCNLQWYFWAEASLRYLIYIWNFSLKIQFIFPF